MFVQRGRFAGNFVLMAGKAFARLSCTVLFSAATLAASAWGSQDLTPAEQRWIAAAQPVLAYARTAGLPLDIIVQPVVRPEVSPMSMAFINGRCKLVLTMRGNPMVERQLSLVPPDMHNLVIEVMTAHELGHCWRHIKGDWGALPAAFASARQSQLAEVGLSGAAEKQRREEGFADLVGLAWTRNRHPAQYAQIHAWLTEERSAFNMPGARHDTAIWVALAHDPAVFHGGATLFEQARLPWEAGLQAAGD